MYVEQLYTNCLAHAAYYIESDGEAAIIDPLRDTEGYQEVLERRGTRLKYIFETHFHADFVSGHIDLARATGAQIVYGPGANTEYAIYVAHDKEVFKLGSVELTLWHTPGHTLESSCILLSEPGKPVHAIFTGDTLFVGDAGRPDLAVKSDLTSRDLAALLYESLQRLKTLPDDTIMYPGHGPGSACGKNIGKETQSTIGIQKQLNPALNTTDIETFINLMTEGLGTPPPYFFRDALINKQGYDPIDEVLQINMRGLDVVAFRQAIADGALVLDTRPSEDFEQGFIANALNIGLNGSFAQWVGALISIDQPLVLVTEPGREREAVLRLARIGFEHVRGYLEGGMENWKAQGGEVQTIRSIDASELKSQLTSVQILDVRNPGEYDNAHLPDARLVPLAKLPEHIEQLASSQPWYVHCAGGYRSMAAASVLKAHGIEAINIRGGMNKILEVGLPVVCLQS